MLRLLGFLFLVVLVVVGVGYFRGWYSFNTVEAGGKTGVTFDINKEKIGKDTAAAADKLAKLSAKAAEKIKQFAQEAGDGLSTIEGGIATVDAAANSFQLEVGTETIDLNVPSTAKVIQNGADVTLAELKAGLRVRVTVEQKDSDLRVTRVEVLP